jgi:hypothetical protein
MRATVKRVFLAAASVLLLCSSMVPIAHAASRTSSGSAVTESEFTKHGKLSCTVSFPSTTLDPGGRTGGHMKVTNMTDHDVTFSVGFRAASIIVRDDGGSLLVNTADWPYPSPAPVPVTLPAHRSRRLDLADTVIRWPGTLSITPVCDVGQRHPLHMHRIHFAVAVPPGAPDEATALATALGTTAGLFDDCSPQPNDSPVIGSLDPWGASGKALHAACRATVDQEPGFSVVNIVWESPASLPTVDPPDLGFFVLPRHRSEVQRYVYVVSSAGVKSYVTVGGWQTPVSTERYRTFSLTRTGTWERSDFAPRCGDGVSFGGGSSGRPEVAIINACPLKR